MKKKTNKIVGCQKFVFFFIRCTCYHTHFRSSSKPNFCSKSVISALVLRKFLIRGIRGNKKATHTEWLFVYRLLCCLALGMQVCCTTDLLCTCESGGLSLTSRIRERCLLTCHRLVNVPSSFHFCHTCQAVKCDNQIV